MPCGSEARHPPRLRRHAAPAARGGAWPMRMDDDHRHPGPRRARPRSSASSTTSCRATCSKARSISRRNVVPKAQGPPRRIRDLSAEARRRPEDVLRRRRARGGESLARLPGAARDRRLRSKRRPPCPSTKAARTSARALRRALSEHANRRRCATCSSPSARRRRFPTCRKTRRRARSRRPPSSAPAPWAAASR